MIILDSAVIHAIKQLGISTLLADTLVQIYKKSYLDWDEIAISSGAGINYKTYYYISAISNYNDVNK